MDNINVNPYAYEDLTCTECGHNVFVPGIVFKKIPGVLVGDATRKFVPFPIKVACCAKCGALSAEDKEDLEKQAAMAKKAETANKSSLII